MHPCFYTKNYGLEKVVNWKLLELPQKLPSQISVIFCMSLGKLQNYLSRETTKVWAKSSF